MSPDLCQNRKYSQCRRYRSRHQSAVHQLEENTILLELAIDENDEEVKNEIESNLDKIVKEVEDIEFRHMLNGEHDINNAFVNINSGAGGTEAQDWTEMLLRMYLRWAENLSWGN